MFLETLRRSFARVGGQRTETRALIEGLENRRLLSANISADFNGDGHQDLLWRNYSTGENAIWYQNGADRIGVQMLPTAPNINWQIGGTGDMNGDGVPDIIWRNASTGENAVWYLARVGGGVERAAVANLPTAPNTDWKIAGVNDINGNGRVEILFRNLQTGTLSAWSTGGADGTTITAYFNVGVAADAAWVVGGTGDLNNDGKVEIIWRHIVDGRNAVWYLDSHGIVESYGLLASAPNISWQIQGVVDLDGDGKADLIWRNASTGNNAVWLMDGATPVGYPGLVAAPNLNWQITGSQTL